MKPLTRRSVTTGLVAAVTAVPVAALAGAATTDPLERIKHHTRELEKAMREHYGAEVETLSFGATGDMKPCVFVVAHTQGDDVALLRNRGHDPHRAPMAR